MDLDKVLFISQEIAPYLPDSPLATFGRELPQAIQAKQERGSEVRTFMPKYGAINERRNQLHEVIRLSGMNLIIDDTDHPLIIKVATLQPARMQVYFIFNDDYFTRNITKELEIVSMPDDNDERCIFFVRGVLETVRKLRWVPNVIHCNGWISALAPLYIRNFYGDDPLFHETKIIYSLFDDDFVEPFNSRFYDKLKFDGMPDEEIGFLKDKQAGYADLTQLALLHCDGVIQSSEEIKPEVMELVKKSGKPFMPYRPWDGDAQPYIDFYNTL